MRTLADGNEFNEQNTQSSSRSIERELRGNASLDERLDEMISLLEKIAGDTPDRGNEGSRGSSRSPIRNYSDYDRYDRYANRGSGAVRAARYSRDSGKSDPAKTFLDGITDQMMKSLGRGDVEKQMEKNLREFARKMGTTVEDLPNELGKQLTGAFQKTDLGKKLTGLIDRNVDKYFMGIPKSAITKAGEKGLFGKYSKNIAGALTYSSKGSGAVPPPSTESSGAGGALAGGALSAIIGGAIGTLLLPGAGTAAGAELGAAAGGAGAIAGGTVAGAAEGALAAGATEAVAGEGMAALAEGAVGEGITDAVGAMGESLGIGEIIDMLGPIMESTNILSTVASPIQAIMPLIEGVAKAVGVISKIFNKDTEMDEERTKHAQERYRKDIEAMVEIPFDILEDAAKRVIQVWDDNLRKINQTQGYDKASLQGLMSAFAKRLQQEGLTSVVSAADITGNLSRVLDTGLSGEIANEFAYIATILNEAIPTQDFFSYGSAYASLASNAVQMGKSQAEAIEYANEQLKQFASNVLYSSRVLTGGFTTGLTNASDLFELAVQIANSSRSGNVSNISSVLTAVAGVVGAVAPDLAGGLTSLIGTLATGGNSGTAVALRSLAGINASNTEFLQAFAQDPQGIIANVFGNLAKYQTMSEGNYMEVAEGLAQVFGVDMGALARVDFASLANDIRSMSVNTSSLDENMSLLQSGQSTLTSEQQRMEQINKVMIEEGLALVLDNEAGRAIQEHMWQEQLANQLMEATYGIDLQGAGLDILQSLRSTLKNLVSLIFPWFGAVKSAVNLATTSVQMADQEASIAEILNAGKVGKGNAKEFMHLTSRGKDLPLIGDLQSLWGIQNGLHNLANMSEIVDMALSGNWLTNGTNLYGGVVASIYDAIGSRNVKSQYRWGALSKSARNALKHRGAGGTFATNIMSAEDAADLGLKDKLDAFIATMDSAVQSDMTFESWLSSSSKFGLKRENLSSSLSKVGQSLTNLEEAFADTQTEKDKEKSAERLNREVEFWNKSTLNDDSYLKTMSEEITDLHKDIRVWANSWDNVNNRFSTYYDPDRYMGSIFGDGTGKSSMWSADNLLNRYQTLLDSTNADTPTALAEALTDSLNDLDLRDPTLQTNTLLAQLIKVVAAILQAVNTPGKMDIPSSLSAMALGLMNQQ